MADTRAAHASRRASGRATTEPATGNARGRPRAGRTAERAMDEPRVEHPGEDDDYINANAERDYRDDHHEDTESLHPSQHPNAFAQGRCNILIFIKIKNLAFIAWHCIVCAFGWMNFTKIQNYLVMQIKWGT